MLISMALQPGDPGTRVSVGRAAGAADGARARLEAGRAEILERHRAGAGGQEVVRSISALTDDVVQAMFAGISGELQGAAPPRVALIATGGYGRRGRTPRPSACTAPCGMPGSKRGSPPARWGRRSSSPARTTPPARRCCLRRSP